MLISDWWLPWGKSEGATVFFNYWITFLIYGGKKNISSLMEGIKG